MFEFSINRLRSLCLSLALVMCLLPFIYGLHYINIYAINVPYWDQWDTIVPWIVQYYGGSFDFIELIGQQCDSRPIVSNVIIFLASIMTDLDIKGMFYLGYIFYIFCIILVIYFIKTDVHFIKTDAYLDCMTLLLIMPIFYYAFNPYYMVRFIQNIGSIQYPTMLLCALATIYLLYRSKNSYSFFFLSLLTGSLCTFSFVAGLSIWFAGLFQLSIQRMNDKGYKILLWIVTASTIFYIYYVYLGFKSTGRHGLSAYSSFLDSLIDYPIQKFLCVMGTLGSEVIHQREIALYFGLIISVVLIALIAVNRHSLQLDHFSKWYGSVIFGLLTSIEVALTRSGDEIYFGGPDTIYFIPGARHSLAIFLPLLCIYVLAIFYAGNSAADDLRCGSSKSLGKLLMERRSPNLFLLGILFVLLLLGIILHVMPGIEAAELVHNQQVENQYYLYTYRIQTDENLKRLNPSADTVRENARLLERYKLSVFAQDALDTGDLDLINVTDGGDGAHARIESINMNIINHTLQTEPKIIGSEDDAIEITGWAVDKRAGEPAGAVIISIDNEMDVPSLYGLERPDVSAAYNNEDFRYSGFRASFSSSILDPGPHNATLKVVSEGRDGYYLSDQRVDFILCNAHPLGSAL